MQTVECYKKHTGASTTLVPAKYSTFSCFRNLEILKRKEAAGIVAVLKQACCDKYYAAAQSKLNVRWQKNQCAGMMQRSKSV
jgi:hypothetical protein